MCQSLSETRDRAVRAFMDDYARDEARRLERRSEKLRKKLLARFLF